MSCISFVTNNFCIKTLSISLEDIICRIGDLPSVKDTVISSEWNFLIKYINFLSRNTVSCNSLFLYDSCC